MSEHSAGNLIWTLNPQLVIPVKCLILTLDMPYGSFLGPPSHNLPE
jgi:hypothetical protein